MVDHQELFFDFANKWQELLDQIDHEKDEKMHHFEAMKSSNVHFTFFRMGKILEGLLAGAVEAEVPHGVECLRDSKHIWERFGGVIDQLKHATFNSTLHSIEDLGHVIHDIANELEECKATVGTDLDKLREMSKAFTDPWYFIFHVEHDLIVNGQDIHHEITDAQAQWDNQHFYEFGHSIGLSLSKIFLGGKMKNQIPFEHLPSHDGHGYRHGYSHGYGYGHHGDSHHDSHGYGHNYHGYGDHGGDHSYHGVEEHGEHGYDSHISTYHQTHHSLDHAYDDEHDVHPYEYHEHAVYHAVPRHEYYNPDHEEGHQLHHDNTFAHHDYQY